MSLCVTGKAVIHSEATNKKLLEIKRILEVDLGEEMVCYNYQIQALCTILVS